MNKVKVRFKAIEKNTIKAFLILFDTGKPVWVPKSKIVVNEEEKFISLPLWLYTKILQENNVTMRLK